MKILTVAGMICSGKSTIAERLSNLLGAPYTSFSEYIRAYCKQEGLSDDRKTLQDVGKQLVEVDAEKFLQDVVANCIHKDSDAPLLIIDGLRHTSMLEIIRRLYPSSTLLYVDVPLETRYRRYTARKKEGDKNYSFEGFQEYCGHPVEAGVEDLKPLADIVVTPENEESVLKKIRESAD